MQIIPPYEKDTLVTFSALKSGKIAPKETPIAVRPQVKRAVRRSDIRIIKWEAYKSLDETYTSIRLKISKGSRLPMYL